MPNTCCTRNPILFSWVALDLHIGLFVIVLAPLEFGCCWCMYVTCQSCVTRINPCEEISLRREVEGDDNSARMADDCRYAATIVC